MEIEKRFFLWISGAQTNGHTMANAFYGAENLQVLATDTPDFSAVTDMGWMFHSATAANPDTSGWDTSAVTNMHGMFQSVPPQPTRTPVAGIRSGNNMSYMFSRPPSQPGHQWLGYGSGNKYAWMFNDATAANPDTSGWDTAAVTDMHSCS